MKLILLDCDGVLVDSEFLIKQQFSQLLSARGVVIDEDACQREFTGLTVGEVYKIIHEKYNKNFSQAEINLIEEELNQYLVHNLQAIGGVVELLNDIKDLQLPFCIVSNGSPTHIRSSLHTTGLLPLFADQHIFSATMVSYAKPAPDLLLHAAKIFNYAPQDCLVIEDSHFGIQAANAAGMPSIAFFGGLHAQDNWYQQRVLAQNPSIVCADMLAVRQALRNSLLKF